MPSFFDGTWMCHQKTRHRMANPEGARYWVPFLFAYFLFGQALRRWSGANGEAGPEGAEGRMPGVKRK